MRRRSIDWARLAAGSLLAGALILAAPAAGQGMDPRDRLAREIETTDQVIADARAIVGASESSRAREILPRAVEMQELAHRQFMRCGMDNLTACEGAARATTRARREARRAIQIARSESGLDVEVAHAIERAAGVITEAQVVIGGQGHEVAEQRLAEARTKLERAREQHRARQFRIALNLARAAEREAREVAGLGRIDRVRPERLQIELERTDRLLERTAPGIRESQNERAIRELERAIMLQQRGRAHFVAGRPAAAVRFTREARDAVHGALLLVEEPVDSDQVERALSQTDALIERVASVVRESGRDEAFRLLDAAREHQRRARELLGAGQRNMALAETRIARNLALEAEDLVQLEGELGG